MLFILIFWLSDPIHPLGDLQSFFIGLDSFLMDIC